MFTYLVFTFQYCHTEGFIHRMAELFSIAKAKKNLLHFTYLRVQIPCHV